MINVVDESGNSNSPYSPVAERKFTHFVPRSKFLQNEYSDLPRPRQRGLGSMDYDKVFQDPSSFKRSQVSAQLDSNDKDYYPSKIVQYQRESSSSQGGNNHEQFGYDQYQNMADFKQGSSRSQIKDSTKHLPSRSKETKENTLSSPFKNQVDMEDQFNPISLVSALGKPDSERVFSPMAVTNVNQQNQRNEMPTIQTDFLIRHSEEEMQQQPDDSPRTQNFPEQDNEVYEYQDSDNEQLIEDDQNQQEQYRLHAQSIELDTDNTHLTSDNNVSYPQSLIANPQFQNFSNQFMRKDHDPNESLSRPAIISLSSNQKVVSQSRQNILTYSPSQGNSNQYVHMASRSSFGEPIVRESNSMSGSQQVNRDTIMALSKTNTDGQNNQYQSHLNQEASAEMEGLDLTDENIDVQNEQYQHNIDIQNEQYQDQQQPIVLEQNSDLYGLGMNHLSSIHDSPSSQTKEINLQQQDLDEVEANLEQEVHQLNQIYAQYQTLNKPNAYLAQMSQRQQESQRYNTFQRNQNSQEMLHRRASSHDDFQEEIKSDDDNIAKWSEQKLEYQNQTADVNQFNVNSISGQMELKESRKNTDQSDSEAQPDNHELVQALVNQVQICELRIQELAPNHPLPITQEHLGLPNPDQSDRESLFKQIARYQEQVGYMAKGHKQELEQFSKQLDHLKYENEKLKSQRPPLPSPVPQKKQAEIDEIVSQNQQLQIQVTQLKQENQRLQQVLRDETCVNEEQRGKIAILKESLEKKLDPAVIKLITQMKPDGKAPVSQRGLSSQISMANIAPSPQRGESPKSNNTSLIEQYVSVKTVQNENQRLKKQLEQVDNAQQVQKLDQLTQALDSKNQDLVFYKTELQKLQKQLAGSQDEIRHLLSQMHQLSNKLVSMESINQEIANMNDQNIDLKSQIEVLQQKLKDHETIGESMKMEINESQLRVSQFKDRVKDENGDKVQLYKRLDELEITNSHLQDAKDRLVNEKEMLLKKTAIEVDSLKQIISQNKEYCNKQEERIREINLQYQQEVLEQRQKHESQSVDQMKQISTLNQKVADLEQKCFTAQLQNEASLEVSNQNHSYEMEALKNKQLSEKVKQLQSQILNANSRVNVQDTKVQTQHQTIENLKQQNEWLKDERTKIQHEVSDLKKEIENERKENLQKQSKLNLFEQQNKDFKERVQVETDRIQQDNDQILTKMRESEQNAFKLKQENEVLKENQEQLDKRFIGMQSDLHALRRDKALAESQLQDLSQENDQLYRNEERTKQLMSEIQELRSHIKILEKEVSFADSKRSEVVGQLQSVESELRLALRHKNEFEEKLTSLKLQKETQASNMERSSQENLKLHQEIDSLKSECQKLQLDKKVLNNRLEELCLKLNKTEKMKEDMQAQISRNIQKSNDYCMRFEQENKVLEGIRLIQNNSHKALILPFLQQMTQQVEVSDILKESLYANSEEALDYFIRLSEPFTQIDTESEGRDTLQTERQIQFEYIKFLHQDVIEKLTQAIIEQKSENILLSTKNKNLNKRLVQAEDHDMQTAKNADKQDMEIMNYESMIQELQQENKRNENVTAGLRQKICNLEQQSAELFALNCDKETQIQTLNHDSSQLQKHVEIVTQLKEDITTLQLSQDLEVFEKKYLWKALKSLKTFLKSDECFEPLLVMLNEYILLLEQLMFDKKQEKKLGFKARGVGEVQQKLKVVEMDMKAFSLPIIINNCLPQKQVFSAGDTTNYATARQKELGKTHDIALSNTTMFQSNPAMQMTQNNNYFSAKSTTMLGKQLQNLIE